MLVDDLPGGLGSQVQMHMLSVDLSRALRSSGRWTNATDALSNTAFPVYARARLALSGRVADNARADTGAAAGRGPDGSTGEHPSYTDQDHEQEEDDDNHHHHHHHNDSNNITDDGVDGVYDDIDDIDDDDEDGDDDDGCHSSSWTDSGDDSLAPRNGPDLPTGKVAQEQAVSRLAAARCLPPEPSQRELRAARQAAARRAKLEAASSRLPPAASGVAGPPTRTTTAAAAAGTAPAAPVTRITTTTPTSTATQSAAAAYAPPRGARLALQDRPDRTPAHATVNGRCHACTGVRDIGHDTLGRGKGGSSGSSLASDAQPVGGVLRKRGRLSRRLVRRFFTVEGCTLRNHRASPYDRPSWAVDVSGAMVGIDPDKARIVLLIDARRRLVLYGRNAVDARLWADALVAAAEHVPSRPCPVCSPKPATSEVPYMADRQKAEADRDPTNDIWDTFRSFAALTLLNSRKMERGSDGSRSTRCRDEEDEVPPHMIYTAFS